MSSPRPPAAPRPRSRDDDRRLPIRFREDERDTIALAAAQLRMTKTEFVRQASLKAAGEVTGGESSPLTTAAMAAFLQGFLPVLEGIYFDAAHFQRRLLGEIPDPDLVSEVPEIS